jgi:hypothetical protein
VVLVLLLLIEKQENPQRIRLWESFGLEMKNDGEAILA